MTTTRDTVRRRITRRAWAVTATALAAVAVTAPAAHAAPVTIQLWPAGQGRIVATQSGQADQTCDFVAVLQSTTPCDVTVDNGSSVTLTAIAEPNATIPAPSPPDLPAPAGDVAFVRWSRFDCPGTGACTFVPADNDWVTALFTPLQLEVLVAGASLGSVTAQATDGLGLTLPCDPPDPLTDETLCHARFAADSQVVLAASTPNSVWGPGCEVNALTCTVTVSNVRTFASVAFGDPALASLPPFPFQITPTLKVRKTGSGSGTVTGTSIDCGSTCTANDLVYQSPVTLTATPATGSTFVRWAGVCGTDRTCRFRAGSATVVGAVFETAAAPGPPANPRPAPQSPPPAPPQAFHPRLLRVAVHGHGAHRLLRVAIIVDRRASVAVRLTKGRRTLASRRSTIRAGRATLRLRVPRHVRRGTYRLVVRVASGAERRTLTSAVRIPR